MHEGMWKTGARRHWRSSRPQLDMPLTQAVQNMIYMRLLKNTENVTKICSAVKPQKFPQNAYFEL